MAGKTLAGAFWPEDRKAIGCYLITRRRWLPCQYFTNKSDALLQRLAAENIRAFASEVVADGVIIQGGGNLTAVAAYRGLMQIQGQSAPLTSHILQPRQGQVPTVAVHLG